jgi:hypothetical protein
MITEPTIVNDAADVSRLNTLLDQILEKPFLSPTVAINAIRAAMDLTGIVLPKLDCEIEIEGPNTPEALSMLMAGKRLPTAPLDVEYLFKILDADHDADVKAGVENDWDNHLYLYIVLNRNDEIGVYEAYAQIVDADDVDALIWADIPKELADLYVDLGGADINGETPYGRMVRHSGTGGFTGEI